MALVEQGAITLGTPVGEILPRFAGAGRDAVTLRHLLTHTSGLPYESPAMEAVLLRKAAVDEILDEAYDVPLRFPPGVRFGYSDFGIGLVGRIVSNVAGEPFPLALRHLVIEPAGLAETFAPPPPELYPRVAHVVGSLADGTDAAMYNSAYALALAHPAFGVVASVADLLRFGRLFTPDPPRRFLSAATVRAMTTDQTGGRATGSILGLVPDAPRPWGLGFTLRGLQNELGFGDLSSPASYGHPGASGCTLVVDPAAGIVLAFVSNRHLNPDPRRFASRLDAVVNAVVAALT
jgi:beta-lactamase class C